MNREITLRLFVAALLLGAFLPLGSAFSAAVEASGDETTAREITVGKGERRTVYQRMTYRGLTVTVPESFRRTSEALQVMGPEALRFIHKDIRLGTRDKGTTGLTLPEELIGQPGLLVQPRIAGAWEAAFTVDRPARLYAFINWDGTDDPNLERDQWALYARNVADDMAVYYRDFAAGEHVIRFDADQFTGAGFSPLDGLSEMERLVAVLRIGDEGPLLEVRSDFDAPMPVIVEHRLVNPESQETVATGRYIEKLAPRAARARRIELPELQPGVLYYVHADVVFAGKRRRTTVPFGRFPVPPDDASVAEPLIPYGGYFKMRMIEDAELRDVFYSAMFSKLRSVKMNACVLDPSDTRLGVLDLAQEYGIKCVIRLAGKGGDVRLLPDEVIHHAAVLTYMVGDEPRLEELDVYRKAFETVTARYPGRKPITATVYDSWGLGIRNDPSIIFNYALADLPLQRFGRLYCFRRPGYGLLRPVEYKRWQDVASIMSALEISSAEPWWLAPQFFGHDNSHPYWRVPNGPELTGVMHMALAHNCRGMLGWALHSHGDGLLQSVGWEGDTLAPARHQQHDALRAMGEHIAAVKEVLLRRTEPLVGIYWLKPYELHAAGHWLTDGRMLLYVVNRDADASHAGRLKVFLGGGPKKRDRALLPVMEEVAAVHDLVSGREVSFEKETPGAEVPNYLVISTDAIEPGGARVLVVSGRGEEGRFLAAPPMDETPFADDEAPQ